eukprot:scaffold225488_cov21-Tisochrysis_lutea.AAC.1
MSVLTAYVFLSAALNSSSHSCARLLDILFKLYVQIPVCLVAGRSRVEREKKEGLKLAAGEGCCIES